MAEFQTVSESELQSIEGGVIPFLLGAAFFIVGLGYGIHIVKQP